LGKWSRGDQLESEPTYQPTSEELKTYRYFPGPCLWLARTGSRWQKEHRLPVLSNNPVPGPGQHRQCYERWAKNQDRERRAKI